jgi:hypothetical protein
MIDRMSRVSRPLVRRRTFAHLVPAALILVAIAACGGDSSTPATPTPTTPTAPPPVTLSPVTLTFTGLTTDSQAVTLTNTGSKVLAVTSVAVTGNFAETDNCVGMIDVGGTCSINVTFVRRFSTGGGSSGAVTITDDASTSPQGVVLAGPLVTPPAGVLSPSTLTFSGQAVGTSSAAQTLTLTNTINGFSAPLTINGIAATGDFVISQNGCGASLAPGASCSIGIRFAPTAAGARIGVLTIFDNAPSLQQSAVLSGTGQ